MACESLASAATDSQRSLPTPFLTKTYQLVDDPSVDDLISWNDDGSAFIGFRKVVPDRWEFVNDCFRRGDKGLLRDIQRRKITPAASATATVAAAAPKLSPSNSGDEQVISSNLPPVASMVHRITSSMTTSELLKENERLRKENTQISRELTRLKGLCNKIVTLMTNHASGM
ncbi:E3 ubiquitin-protein ligase [Hibiscus syriacus]|uniref:E3 ubiquitin-protein ligase n=1 Tax=Hibiscus syriacus TaxID=106335 RepID=A0A6A2YCZ8_HIBSY|nr:E3 ubiquitin-protein ligase [Hibiscus syriacus]